MARQSGPTTSRPHDDRLPRRTGETPNRRSGVLPVLLVGVMAVLMLTLVTGCVGDDVPEVAADDAQLVTGREVYARNCVACHGAAGQGGTGPKLSDGVVVERYPDIQDHIDIIVNGRNQMPAYEGKLTQEEIEAVVRYNREVL